MVVGSNIINQVLYYLLLSQLISLPISQGTGLQPEQARVDQVRPLPQDAARDQHQWNEAGTGNGMLVWM